MPGVVVAVTVTRVAVAGISSMTKVPVLVTILDTKEIPAELTDCGGSRPLISIVMAVDAVPEKSVNPVTVAVVTPNEQLISATPAALVLVVTPVTVHFEQPEVELGSQLESKVRVIDPPSGMPCARVKPTMCLTLIPSEPRTFTDVGETVTELIAPDFGVIGTDPVTRQAFEEFPTTTCTFVAGELGGTPSLALKPLSLIVPPTVVAVARLVLAVNTTPG